MKQDVARFKASEHLKSLPKYRSVFTVLGFGVVALVASASAQDNVITFEPGDSRIVGDTTVPHISRWSMTRIVPGRKEQQIGVWLDRHEIVEVDGRVLHRFQSDVVPLNGRPRRDVVFWDQSTMETVSAELENYNMRGGWAHFAYDKNRVSEVFRREPFDETHLESFELESRVFEVGHGLVFLNLLKLQPGGRVRYRYHSRSTDEVKSITFEAVEYQKLDTARYGKVDTLVVDTSTGARYWTVPDVPYVYRLDIPTANDGIDRWELLDYIVE